jgi:hypothetical protein
VEIVTNNPDVFIVAVPKEVVFVQVSVGGGAHPDTVVKEVVLQVD